MNYNLLTSSDLNAAQITSEVTEQVVTKTNRWISFWNEHVPDLISFGVEIGFSLLIFFVGRFLIRWIRRIVRRSIERSSADTGVEQFIDSLLKFLLYTLLLFIIIQNLGVPSTSIAAVIASAGVAVSPGSSGESVKSSRRHPDPAFKIPSLSVTTSGKTIKEMKEL